MNHMSLRRLLAGVLTVGLGSALFLGCNEGTPPAVVQNPGVSLTTTVDEPADVTAIDLAQTTVKPADPADAVATMTTPTLSAPEGMSVASAGTESLLQVDYGNTGATTGSLPLVEQNGLVRGDNSAVLPAGDNAIRLSPGTELDLDDVSALQTRGVRQCLRVSDMQVRFSTHRGRPSTWTLPNHFKLDMERVTVNKKKMYVLKNSYLKLFWNGRRAVPPQDGTVTITANLYDGDLKVAGPLQKTVTVEKDTALFTGNTNVPFNRVEITIDLRDRK